jgi:hypothetical protein
MLLINNFLEVNSIICFKDGGKRDLADFFLNTLGLGQIWQQIQGVGANLLGQFTAEITQLIFAGQQVLEQAKYVFN